MTICITGWRSKIAEEFRKVYPGECYRGDAVAGTMPEATRYLFCQGLLYAKRGQDQTEEERRASYDVNYHSIVEACDSILARQGDARICVIGSESAYRGSFDDTYAISKMLLHSYVTKKRLNFRHQQLVCISPGIIEDAGMTTRRTDLDRLDARRSAHPMKRFVTSEEVALLAFDLLMSHPYVSGTVVRMHGGE